MLRQLTDHHWLPALVPHDHPLVLHFLREQDGHLWGRLAMMGALGLFLLFGGLSLPMLYFFLSLLVRAQLAAGIAHRLTQTGEHGRWELVRAAPFSRREILHSAWSAGLWQLRRNHLLALYWLLHVLMALGVLVYVLSLSDMSPDHGLLVLVTVTLLILLQPGAELYFSGMVGLLCGSLVSDRLISPGLAVTFALLYWVLWVIGVWLVILVGVTTIPAVVFAALLTLPLLFPAILGTLARHAAERVAR